MITSLFNKLVIPALTSKLSKEDLENVKSAHIHVKFEDLNSLLQNVKNVNLEKKDNFTIAFAVALKNQVYQFFVRVTDKGNYLTHEKFSKSLRENPNLLVNAIVYYNLMSMHEIKKRKEEIMKEIGKRKFKFDEEMLDGAIKEVFEARGISSIELEFIEKYKMTFVYVKGVTDAIIVFGTEFFCDKKNFPTYGLNYFDFYFLAKYGEEELARKLVISYMEVNKISFDYNIYTKFLMLFKEYVAGKMSGEDIEAEISMMALQKIM